MRATPGGGYNRLAVLGVLLLLATAASPAAPGVDPSAVQDAIEAARSEVPFSSSAAYAHFLRSRLAHQRGDVAGAITELSLALATDADHPYLLHALAEELARGGSLARAERELTRLLQRHPRDARAQLLMGRVLLEGGKHRRARAHLRRAVALAPTDPDAYLVLTQLALEERQLDQAVRTVEELGRALPGETVGHRRLGLVLAERGEPVRAEPLLEYAVRYDPHDLEAWLALAQLYEGQGRAARAEDAYARALEQDPDNREVLLGAGRLALRQDQGPTARAYFDRLMLLSQEPELVVKVAFAYLALRQVQSASEVLDRALRLEEIDPRIAFYAGLVRERLRQYERAEQAYAHVPAGHELFHEARMHRGSCLSLLGRHAEALALLETAIADRGDYLELYIAQARALERASRAGDAERALRGALERLRSPELFEAMAQLYERQGRAAEGLQLLREALAHRPRDESLLYILGAAYERSGDLDLSIRKMRAVLEVNPQNAAAMNFIGYTLAERGRDYDEAERLLVRALELRPDSGEFLDSLGWIYFRKGQLEAAVTTLERAERLAPDEPVIIEHLGDAYRSVRRLEDARKAYRRALETLQLLAEPTSEQDRQRAALEQKLKLLSTEAAAR